MSTFVVNSASYNASSPGFPGGSSNSPDTWVFVQGTIDGTYCNALLWWSAIQTANAFGVGEVQRLIGYWFKKYVEISPKILANQPTFPVVNNIPAPVSGNVNGTSTTCQAAMVGTWTA